MQRSLFVIAPCSIQIPHSSVVCVHFSRFHRCFIEASWELCLVNSWNNVTAKATMGLLSTLLQWNNLDPPSSSEVLRNSRVCSLYQGNRNPFVDHPEYASSIWGAPDVMSGPIRPSESAVMSGPEKEKKIPKAWINEIHYTNEGQDQDEV